LTSGEPAGIGPDLCIAAALREWPCELIVIADRALIAARAKQLNLALRIREYDPLGANHHVAGTLTLLPSATHHAVVPGWLDASNAPYVLAMLDRAADGCMQSEFDALVTAPVQKSVINDAGVTFSGHTEYLAERTGGKRPVMMLVAGNLRIALATTHLPLNSVSAAITRESLRETLRIVHQDLRNRFGIDSPRILVCGLNPHAGESGHLGREEIDTIAPVIRELQNEGLHLTGPAAADTAFTPRMLECADAVLAMFHDQGLPVLKYAGFGSAVNVTLGLPIIRTSVDHGTALDLAGTGKAESGSLLAALELALALTVDR
jgi:4-hydroxythreonine-4-phosphate dehydrogenase